jgi:hypothetical protein
MTTQVAAVVICLLGPPIWVASYVAYKWGRKWVFNL